MKSKLLRQVSTSLLMMAYLWLFMNAPLHFLAHTKTETQCTEKENKCHLRMVHGDKKNGCDHNTHIIEQAPTCTLCALFQKSLAHTASFDSHKAEYEQYIQSSSPTAEISALFLVLLPESRGSPNILS